MTITDSSYELQGAEDGDYTYKSGSKSGKKLLYFLIAFLCLACIGLIVGIIILRQKTGDASEVPSTTTAVPEVPVCLTTDCIKSASSMLEVLNPDVDPCEDFYQFACGNWDLKYVIPEASSSYGTFSKIRDDVNIALKVVMERHINDTSFHFSRPTMWAKQVFDSCMDTVAVDSAGITPITDLFNELGGWSLGTGSDDNQLWLTLVTKARKYDSNYLILGYVGTDGHNSSRRSFYLDQPSLGLPAREDYMPKKNQILSCANSGTTECEMVDDPADNRNEEQVFWESRSIKAYQEYLTTLALLSGFPIRVWQINKSKKSSDSNRK